MLSPPRSLQHLLAPRSVAVVGATERPQHGSIAFRNLTQGGFTGRAYAVNPRYRQVFGHVCYPDLESLPETPDCVVLAVAAAHLPGILRRAGEIGVKAAVVFSAGFAEAGDEGRMLQVQLADVAREHSIALCGPNCMGVVNVAARTAMYTVLVPPDTPRGRVGVVAQSGSVSYLLFCAPRIACSYVISSGNQAILDAADYVDFLVDDPETDTVALFLEAIPRPEPFRRALMRAHERGKPVVICRPGRSPRAAEAMRAHTGSLAGAHEIFAAFCRQHGAILVEDLDEMVETLVMLSTRRRRVTKATLGAINCSGGENALLGDVAEAVGVELPPLAEATVLALRAELPSFATAGNPLDVTGVFYYDGDGFRRCLNLLAKDPNVGVLLSVLDLPAARVPPDAAEFSRPIVEATAAAAREIDKPVAFLTSLSGDVHAGLRTVLADAGVPVLEGTRKGLRAIRHFMDWASFAGCAGPQSDETVAAIPPTPQLGELASWRALSRERSAGCSVNMKPSVCLRASACRPSAKCALPHARLRSPPPRSSEGRLRSRSTRRTSCTRPMSAASC